MAKATIECTCPECGATHTWSVVCHNRREADSWEQYHANEANDRLCPACYAKRAAAQREADRKAASDAAAQNAAKLGLPALAGSEKQVSWAVAIRQDALDGALLRSVGMDSSKITSDGAAFLARVIATMPTDAKWWIDNRDEASLKLQDEVHCANWARIDDEHRAARMAKLHAAVERNEKFAAAILKDYERYERARLAGRTCAEQRAADEAARVAALPPKPAKLAERLGYSADARWNGKFYGPAALRVYINGNEVNVPADVKSAWESEWAAYKAALKSAN